MVSLLFCVQMLLSFFFFCSVILLLPLPPILPIQSIHFVSRFHIFWRSICISCQPRHTEHTTHSALSEPLSANTHMHIRCSILSKWSILKPDHHLPLPHDDDDISLDSCLSFMLCHSFYISYCDWCIYTCCAFAVHFDNDNVCLAFAAVLSVDMPFFPFFVCQIGRSDFNWPGSVIFWARKMHCNAFMR